MLRVLFHGFMKAMNLPSGESLAAEISGSSTNSARSMMGGCCECDKPARQRTGRRIFHGWCMGMSSVSECSLRNRLSSGALPAPARQLNGTDELAEVRNPVVG